VKLKIAIITIYALLLTAQFCFGQNDQKESVIFSELKDQYCSEYLDAELDRYLFELQSNTSIKGHIVFYGKNAQEGRNIQYLNALKSFITHKNFDPDRVIVNRGENLDKMIMQFWIVPHGASAPKLEKIFVNEKINSVTRFDAAWADWHKWTGSEWTIYSYSFVNWGCEMDLNMKSFAEILNSQTQLTGYLVVYTGSGKGKNQGRKVTNFAIKELTKQYKVPKSRLKTIYGGNRNEPELELWFVPNGNAPPLPSPDKIIKN